MRASSARYGTTVSVSCIATFRLLGFSKRFNPATQGGLDCRGVPLAVLRSAGSGFRFLVLRALAVIRRHVASFDRPQRRAGQFNVLVFGERGNA